jgi:hypothetical protein
LILFLVWPLASVIDGGLEWFRTRGQRHFFILNGMLNVAHGHHRAQPANTDVPAQEIKEAKKRRRSKVNQTQNDGDGRSSINPNPE